MQPQLLSQIRGPGSLICSVYMFTSVENQEIRLLRMFENTNRKPLFHNIVSTYEQHESEKYEGLNYKMLLYSDKDVHIQKKALGLLNFFFWK